MPGSNIINFINSEWGNGSVAILQNFRVENIGQFDHDKIYFLLTYYKWCIIMQIYSRPIFEYKEYEPIFSTIIKTASRNGNIFAQNTDENLFREIHGDLGKYVMNNFEKTIRDFATTKVEALKSLGFAVFPPFETKKSYYSGNNIVITAITATMQLNDLFELSLGELGGDLFSEITPEIELPKEW